MTTLLDTETTAPVTDHRRRVIAGVAVVAGLVIGPFDLLLQRVLPYPWANLANSSAVWVVAAFVIGRWVGAGRRSPAVAGALSLVVAVEAYYLAAVVALGDDPSTLWGFTTQLWLVLAVFAGAVFGTTGAWARHAPGWLGAFGTGSVGAVLFAESLVRAARLGGADPQLHTELAQTAVITAILGVFALVLAGRSLRQRALGAAISLPLAVLGAAAALVVGVG